MTEGQLTDDLRDPCAYSCTKPRDHGPELSATKEKSEAASRDGCTSKPPHKVDAYIED